jgi:hypothetical protein
MQESTDVKKAGASSGLLQIQSRELALARLNYLLAAFEAAGAAALAGAALAAEALAIGALAAAACEAAWALKAKTAKAATIRVLVMFGSI